MAEDIQIPVREFRAHPRLSVETMEQTHDEIACLHLGQCLMSVWSGDWPGFVLPVGRRRWVSLGQHTPR